MNRKLYLVLFVVFVALAATGVYVRQRAKAAAIVTLRQESAKAINCDTPAPPPPEAPPPPAVPGFAIEPACGTGADAPTAAKAPQVPAAPPTGTTATRGKTK